MSSFAILNVELHPDNTVSFAQRRTPAAEAKHIVIYVIHLHNHLTARFLTNNNEVSISCWLF